MTQDAGTLYTTNLQGLRGLTIDGEIWQITRTGIDLPGSVRVKALAPSDYLFDRFHGEWKGRNPENWWCEYKRIYNSELKTAEKLELLRVIYQKLTEGKNIILVCFCQDHNYCHRKLVGDVFLTYGLNVVELNPIKYEQLSIL